MELPHRKIMYDASPGSIMQPSALARRSSHATSSCSSACANSAKQASLLERFVQLGALVRLAVQHVVVEHEADVLRQITKYASGSIVCRSRRAA